MVPDESCAEQIAKPVLKGLVFFIGCCAYRHTKTNVSLTINLYAKGISVLRGQGKWEKLGYLLFNAGGTVRRAGQDF